MIAINKLLALPLCSLMVLSCISPALAANTGIGGPTPVNLEGPALHTNLGDTHVQSTPGPVYVRLDLAPIPDSCFERFHGRLPVGYSVLDSTKTAGSCTLADTAAYVQYDAATDTAVAFVGSSTTAHHLSITRVNDVTWNFDSPYTFDYAIVSMPLPQAALVHGPIHIIRIEDSGQVYDLPFFIDTDTNRLYFATSQFCFVQVVGAGVTGGAFLVTAPVSVPALVTGAVIVGASVGIVYCIDHVQGGAGTLDDPVKVTVRVVNRALSAFDNPIHVRPVAGQHIHSGADWTTHLATSDTHWSPSLITNYGTTECSHREPKQPITLHQTGTSKEAFDFYSAMSAGAPVPGRDRPPKNNREQVPKGERYSSQTHRFDDGSIKEIDYYDGNGNLMARVEYTNPNAGVRGNGVNVPDHFHIVRQPGQPRTWDPTHYELPKIQQP